MYVLEVDAIRSILRRHLGMDRFAAVAGRQFRIRPVVGIGILLLIRKGPEYVGKPPTGGLPVGLLP
jgi:hypothetical protein